VRDLAALHVLAMTAPAAAGERFLATGEFRWMREMARTLRAGLGERGRRVPTRELPDYRRAADRPPLGPIAARDHPGARPPRPAHHREKAQRVLGWQPRPADRTILETAPRACSPPTPPDAPGRASRRRLGSARRGGHW